MTASGAVAACVRCREDIGTIESFFNANLALTHNVSNRGLHKVLQLDLWLWTRGSSLR